MKYIKLHYQNPIFHDFTLVGEGLGLPKSISDDDLRLLTYGDLLVKLKVSYPDSVPLEKI